MRIFRPACSLAAALLVALAASACAKRTQPLERPAPMPPPAVAETPSRPAPPSPVRDPVVVPPEPLADDGIASRSLDALNRDSPLRPALYAYDSADLTKEAQQALDANAGLLAQYPTWAITIEGHADERGTPEYNLALGERRAVAARAYLVSLGVAASRLRTVSYGKEFPFDSGHNEAAWAQNRRAHFVITAK